MSLLDVMEEYSKDFDASKDSISSNAMLPAGVYAVRLTKVKADSDNFGNDEVAITLQVVSGDHKDKLEFLNLVFKSNDTEKELPKFVVEKNVKTVLKLATMCGLTLKKGDMKSEETLAKALQAGSGMQFKMILKLGKNKKNPDYPFRNYEFEELDNTPIDISDDEFPF
ncbi:hypothetical protein SAMN02745116_02537 [Pilibacter termitis]|uniref:DUF669 domain-containing protein n=1 Tax=Pilibacter termitis TaxID=263852 RepID=A0A1T4RCV3_9ENTE|nr:hypothetical protein [Pilibacter termitis]SKA13646.1 hypothetical protein SAMN02745116_02537 [Pilibacter termitis]